MSGDVTISNAGVTAVGANKILNSMLAQVSTATFKGRTTGGTGNVEDISATQATALLNAFVGDSGAGGVKGLVPAPGVGDATRFLAGDGSWTVPPGAGDVVGPASSTDSGFAKFDGLTGKLLKDSPSSIAVTDIAALTTSRAVVSNASGFISAATTTATEIGYVNGVTSAIQTQLNGKLPTTITTTGDLIYSSSGTTASRLAIGSDQQILKTVSGLPAWAWPNSSQSTYTTTASISSTDNIAFFTSAGGAYTATMPTASSMAGKSIYLVKTDASLNQITISGLSTTLSTIGESILAASDGSAWVIIQRRIPSTVTSYTPTGSWVTNATYSGFWSRTGDRMIGQIKVAATGAVTATSLTATLPGSLNTDTAKVLYDDSGASPCGVLTIRDSGANTYTGLSRIISSDAATIRANFNLISGGSLLLSGVTNIAPFTFGNNDAVVMNFDVPIVGWGG